MNDDEMKKFMQNIDSDLLCQQLDTLPGEPEIDMPAITQKAMEKLAAYEAGEHRAAPETIRTTQPNPTLQEAHPMKKKRYTPFVAAALIAVVGVSTVYADDLSNFLQSFFNKTAVYETVVDGKAYYLAEPVAIGNGMLDQVIFTQETLNVSLTYPLEDPDKLPRFEIRTPAGDVYTPGGYMPTENGGLFLSFFNEPEGNYVFNPGDKFTLSVGETDYDITLSAGAPVTEQGEILPSAENSIDWMNVGYQKNADGLNLLVSFDDPNLKLRNIGAPASTDYRHTFENRDGIISGGTGGGTLALVATDAQGNSYACTEKESIPGTTANRFTLDAPTDLPLTLTITSISAGYEKQLAEATIAIPADHQETALNTEIDLGLQKLMLKSITRTSDTTAVIQLAMNTGDKAQVQITDPGFYSPQLTSATFRADGGSATATFEIVFEKDLTSFDLVASWPWFVINGQWTLDIQ